MRIFDFIFNRKKIRKLQEQLEQQRKKEAENRLQEQLEQQKKETGNRLQEELKRQRREAENRLQEKLERQKKETENRLQEQLEQQRKEAEYRLQEQLERQRKEEEERRLYEQIQLKREEELKSHEKNIPSLEVDNDNELSQLCLENFRCFLEETEFEVDYKETCNFENEMQYLEYIDILIKQMDFKIDCIGEPIYDNLFNLDDESEEIDITLDELEDLHKEIELEELELKDNSLTFDYQYRIISREYEDDSTDQRKIPKISYRNFTDIIFDEDVTVEDEITDDQLLSMNEYELHKFADDYAFRLMLISEQAAYEDFCHGYMNYQHEELSDVNDGINFENNIKQKLAIQKDQALINKIQLPEVVCLNKYSSSPTQVTQFNIIDQKLEKKKSRETKKDKTLSDNNQDLFLIENEKRKIKQILNKRKIKSLYHFTRVENLSSILKHGLIPVNLHKKSDLKTIYNDKERWDSKLDCTSCSVGFPNYRLFYKFRNKFPSSKWVVIALSVDILLSLNNIVYYCETNAARVMPRVTNIKELCTPSSFENMFNDIIIINDDKVIRRSKLNVSDHYTTDPQAEILISGIIKPKYISCISFFEDSDIDDYLKNDNAILLNKYKYQVDSSLFAPRNDYMFWK